MIQHITSCSFAAKNTAANIPSSGRMLPYPWCHLGCRQFDPAGRSVLSPLKAVPRNVRRPSGPTGAPFKERRFRRRLAGVLQARPPVRLPPARTLWQGGAWALLFPVKAFVASIVARGGKVVNPFLPFHRLFRRSQAPSRTHTAIPARKGRAVSQAVQAGAL